MHFEANSEFEDILKTYNNQMCSLEHENHTLIQEIKRTCKAETVHAKIQSELAQK